MTGQSGCDINCATSLGAPLNQRCACELVDVVRLHEVIRSAFPGFTSDPTVHAHLFSPYALFVDRAALDAMGRVATVIFDVAANRRYRQHVMKWAPSTATHDPGSAGGVLGLDFHLTVDGPRLIEVNTNPGGLLLNAMLLDGVRSCAPAAWTTWTTAAKARNAAVAAWLDDARQQSRRMPSRLAIVDSAPREQFLYPEFEPGSGGAEGCIISSSPLNPTQATCPRRCRPAGRQAPRPRNRVRRGCLRRERPEQGTTIRTLAQNSMRSTAY